MGADHIVAQGTSLVGSIGVLFQYPNCRELLKTIGVKVEEVKSSPLKAAPNGFEPTIPEARAAIEAMVMDSYAWFKGLVQERRQIDDASLDTRRRRPGVHRPAGAANSSSSTARRRETALDWLAKEKERRAENCPVRDWKLKARFGDLPFLHLGAS